LILASILVFWKLFTPKTSVALRPVGALGGSKDRHYISKQPPLSLLGWETTKEMEGITPLVYLSFVKD